MAVETSAFFQAAEKAHGKPLSNLSDAWLGGDSLAKLSAEVQARHRSRRFWSVDSFERQLDKSLIVYGTLAEADVQRQAAQRLQRKLAGRWANIDVPIKADTEVSDAVLKDAHILLVGRPLTNRLTARLAGSLPVQFGSVSVNVAGETYANPQTAIVAAGPSPMAADRSVVVFAGLGTEGMWDCIARFPDRGHATAEVLIVEAGSTPRGIAVTSPSTRKDPLMSASPRRRDEERSESLQVR